MNVKVMCPNCRGIVRSLSRAQARGSIRIPLTLHPVRQYSSLNPSNANTPGSDHSGKTPSSPPSKTPEEGNKSKAETPKRSTAEQDSDLQERMRQAMGDADMANVEMEDGVPDSGMRRNVRANMFRII